MRYRVSKDANQDLDQIFLYWARRAGLKVADRLVDSILDRFWLLGEYPDAGVTGLLTRLASQASRMGYPMTM